MMHVFDHHGVTSTICGSTVHLLVKNCAALGANQDARLEKINAEKQAYYDGRVVSSRMPNLKLSNLTVDGWSELCGPVVKAANTRHFSPFLEHLFGKYMDGSPYHKAVFKLVCSLNAVYGMFYNAGRFLTLREQQEAEFRLLKLGKYMMACRGFAEDVGDFMFQVKPKSHYAQHMAQQCQLLNPVFTQCYAEESLIGKITAIWHKSCSGQYLGNVQMAAICKYLLLLCILLDL